MYRRFGRILHFLKTPKSRYVDRFRYADFFVDAMQALRDQFYTDLNQEETNSGAPARDKDEGTTAEQGGLVPPTVGREHKFQLRKKAKDDFFASDDEDLEKKRKVKYESENAAMNAKRAKPR